MSVMKVAVAGASGYVGAELVGLLTRHHKVKINHLLVSENSQSSNLRFSQLHPKWLGVCDTPLQAFNQQWFQQHAPELDAIFFATPHEYSVQWAPAFLDIGVKVFDLSGGFRLKEKGAYSKYYGFEHHNSQLLTEAVYGLAEWQAKQISQAQLVAVPGCYPTASLIALKPVTNNLFHQPDNIITVNGVSGVSGAGRKASLTTSFNEVSLSPYNILEHRHQPEISQEANTQVIFNPHLAPYKRGLLVTITVPLKSEVTANDMSDAYLQAYHNQPIVRLVRQWPKVDNVVNTPFADLHWQINEDLHVLVVSCAIDNLLKGAASQAIQCVNLSLGLKSSYCLLPDKQEKADE